MKKLLMLLALISLVSCGKKTDSDSSSTSGDMGHIGDSDFDGINDFVEKDNGLNPYIVNLPVKSFKLQDHDLVIGDNSFKLKEDVSMSKWRFNTKSELVYNIGCLPMDAFFDLKDRAEVDFRFKVKENLSFSGYDISQLNYNLWLGDYRVEKDAVNILKLDIEKRCVELKITDLSYEYKKQKIDLSSSLDELKRKMISVNVQSPKLAKEYLVTPGQYSTLEDFLEKTGVVFERSGTSLMSLNTHKEEFQITNRGSRFWLTSYLSKGDDILISNDLSVNQQISSRVEDITLSQNQFQMTSDKDQKIIIKIKKKFDFALPATGESYERGIVRSQGHFDKYPTLRRKVKRVCKVKKTVSYSEYEVQSYFELAKISLEMNGQKIFGVENNDYVLFEFKVGVGKLKFNIVLDFPYRAPMYHYQVQKSTIGWSNETYYMCNSGQAYEEHNTRVAIKPRMAKDNVVQLLKLN